MFPDMYKGILDLWVRCWGPRGCADYRAISECSRQPDRNPDHPTHRLVVQVSVDDSFVAEEKPYALTSVHSLGCLVMALFLTLTNVGFRIGRRGSILLGDLFVMVGGAIQAASYCEYRCHLPSEFAPLISCSCCSNHRRASNRRPRYWSHLCHGTDLYVRDDHQQEGKRTTSGYSGYLSHQRCRAGILGMPSSLSSTTIWNLHTDHQRRSTLAQPRAPAKHHGDFRSPFSHSSLSSPSSVCCV